MIGTISPGGLTGDQVWFVASVVLGVIAIIAPAIFYFGRLLQRLEGSQQARAERLTETIAAQGRETKSAIESQGREMKAAIELSETKTKGEIDRACDRIGRIESAQTEAKEERREMRDEWRRTRELIAKREAA